MTNSEKNFQFLNYQEHEALFFLAELLYQFISLSSFSLQEERKERKMN